MQIMFISILNVRCHAMTKSTCLLFVFEYSMAFVFIFNFYHIEDLICDCSKNVHVGLCSSVFSAELNFTAGQRARTVSGCL